VSILSVGAFFGSGSPTPRSIEGEIGGTRMRMGGCWSLRMEYRIAVIDVVV
jgi:hypothetical protein